MLERLAEQDKLDRAAEMAKKALDADAPPEGAQEAPAENKASTSGASVASANSQNLNEPQPSKEEAPVDALARSRIPPTAQGLVAHWSLACPLTPSPSSTEPTRRSGGSLDTHREKVGTPSMSRAAAGRRGGGRDA